MKNSKTLAKTLLAVSSLFLLVGCQQNSNPVPPATPANQPTVTSPAATQSNAEVSIKNFAFDKNTITVKVGTKVKWTNNDSAPHTITSDSGAFDSGNINNGQSFEFTFDKAGTYAYHCAIHPTMKATVTVN